MPPQLKRLLLRVAAIVTVTTVLIGGIAVPAHATDLRQCYGGRWTQVRPTIFNPFWPDVHKYGVPTGTYVQWRWFSTGPLPFYQDDFVTITTIVVPPSVGTNLEFWCQFDTPLWIY